MPNPERVLPVSFATSEQRVGITVAHTHGFPQARLGHVPGEVLKAYGRDTNSRAGRLIAAHFKLSDDHAKYFHDMNENVRDAVLQKADPASVLPDPSARAANLKRREEQVDALAAEIERDERDLAFEQLMAHPHDYSKDRPVDFALQQELRA